MMTLVCTGWAYEVCDQAAQWFLYEERDDRSWSGHDLCTRHVAAAFGNLDSLVERPYIWAVARLDAQEDLLTRMWSGER